jgi:hypothetical protein
MCSLEPNYLTPSPTQRNALSFIAYADPFTRHHPRLILLFKVITAILCFFISLPRTLSELSGMGAFSAITMFIAVLLAMVFAGIQDHPFGYVLGEEPLVTFFPVKGTTFVAGGYCSALLHALLTIVHIGMSAFLNITYTFVGQAAIPSVRVTRFLDDV